MQKTAVNIVKKLVERGYEAYFAGGCVRDLVMKHEPKDYDIVTSAKPDEIEKILEHTIPVGKQFGVIIAIVDGHEFEIASFRSDSGYSDGRRPDYVVFSSAREDALRRDFTINGMFYDPLKKEVIDFVSGQPDLEARLIRFIGDPHTRILEDHLRILRAVRFKNQFDFQYHPHTYEALIEHAQLVSKVSPERTRDELNKMLRGKNRRQAITDLDDIGILEILLPEIHVMKGVAQPYQYHQEGDVFEHTLRSIDSLPPDAPIDLIWAVLLHDAGKPDTFALKERIRFDGHVERSGEIAQAIMKRLRFPNKDIQKVVWIIKHHMLSGHIPTMPKKRQLKWFLEPWFSDLLEVFKADAEGAIPVDLKLYHKVKKLRDETIARLPKKLPKLIAGEEIMKEFNLKSGPIVGKLLEAVHEGQLEKKIRTKKQALELVGKKLKRLKRT